MAGATPALASGVAINGTRICFIQCTPLTKFGFVDPNPQLMCGIYDHLLERVTPGQQIHGFRLLCAPHPGELDVLIPLIGLTESPADTFTPADSLTSFTSLLKLKTTTNVTITLSDCVVNRAIFRGQKGRNPVTLELDIFGKTYSEGATFNPSTITVQAPYAFTLGSLSLRSTATAFSSFVWIYDNHVARRFNNSVTADVLQNTDRTVHFGVNTPYTDDEDDILATFTSSGREAGIAGTITFTNGAKNLVFAHTKALWEATPPTLGPKPDEVRMFQFYKAYANGSNPSVTITQDNT